MKVNDVVQDQWMMFQCTKCFNRFGADRLLVNSEEDVVCPIDKHLVKQLTGDAGLEATCEMGSG